MKRVLKIVGRVLLYIIIAIMGIYAGLWVWNFFVEELPETQMIYGVTFSQIYADELKIDWRKAYLDILDDLKVRRLRLVAYWLKIEPEEGRFDFRDLDFQINEAAERGTQIILSLGRRLPRWPECHIPGWVLGYGDKEQEDFLLEYIEAVVERYKDVAAIKYWQVENEPFLPKFGICPRVDAELLDREIALVRLLDSRPIIISDSGELSTWVGARKRADVFGTTMYRVIWKEKIGYFRYPLPPTFFKFKDFVSRIFAGEIFKKPKRVIVIELQAEAWGPKPITFLTLEEQFRSMDFDDFKDTIGYARKAGFNEVYFWGVEWWFWLKEKAGEPRFWDFAKQIF